MKVLSIKEPFASLISNVIKKIETRSQKTNYRGELFIHASAKGVDKDSLRNNTVLKLTENMKINNGYIICRGNLIACIYMDKNFIEYIKQNPIKYSCGKYKIGRYTWLFEEIEPIPPTSAKGKLNIWNFDEKYKLIEKSIDNLKTN